MFFHNRVRPAEVAVLAIALMFSAAAVAAPQHGKPMTSGANRDGPTDQGAVMDRQDGDVRLGQQVFRFETFGDEGFWTDAVRLPAGIAAAKVTPMQALELGLQIDVDAIDAGTQRQLAEQLRKDPSGRTSAILNDPAVTMALVKANAVIGMPAKGEKVGASCALCHTMADASVFKSPKGGAIGHRIDGLANHDLNLGAIFATAANSRALYPTLQLTLAANKGKTLGRAPTGLTETSTEAEVDAYLKNPAYYPVGMFDDTFDGNGDPMHNSVLFRQDLGGAVRQRKARSPDSTTSRNLVYTTPPRPDQPDDARRTRLVSHKLGGPAGDRNRRQLRARCWPPLASRATPT